MSDYTPIVVESVRTLTNVGDKVIRPGHLVVLETDLAVRLAHLDVDLPVRAATQDDMFAVIGVAVEDIEPGVPSVVDRVLLIAGMCEAEVSGDVYSQKSGSTFRAHHLVCTAT